MIVKPPHWLTAIVATIGTACASLLATNAFPQWRAQIGVIAAVCYAVVAPSLTSKPPPPPSFPATPDVH